MLLRMLVSYSLFNVRFSDNIAYPSAMPGVDNSDDVNVVLLKLINSYDFTHVKCSSSWHSSHCLLVVDVS